MLFDKLSKIAGLLCAALVFMAFAPSKVMSGHVTYSLAQVSNPTTDQSNAYAKITIAMDSAVSFYNTYTTIAKKLSIYYDISVPTANGNINGDIRFGSSRSYMVCGTAMHEIAHTVGVGTCGAWPGLIVNGRYRGTSANAVFRTIMNKQDTVLHGDSQHFWPYGINYESEVKSSADLVGHCKIVNAMQKDFYPNAVLAQSSDNAAKTFFRITNSGTAALYSLPEACFVKISIYTVSGRLVSVLDQGFKMAGENTTVFNAPRKTRGNFIVQLTVGDCSEWREAVIIK
jgi:hypothetical protein